MLSNEKSFQLFAKQKGYSFILETFAIQKTLKCRH